LIDEHTCTSSGRRKTTTLISSWVASLALLVLPKKPQMGAKELQTTLHDTHNCQIAYEIMWKGREKVLLSCMDIGRIVSNSFSGGGKLSDLVIEIELTTKDDGKLYFRRLFCAFGPCLQGFREGCKPYLSVDSTVLNGRWNGHLPSVISVDGHNWMYPVAFGFFESESRDSWTWFFKQLHKAIGRPPKLAICSDACKVLTAVVSDVFPEAEQRECFRHLMQNYIK
jgi:hypothetical protein